MKRILITGKSSYIGNAFAGWLRENGARLPEKMEAELLSLRDGSWRELDFSKYDGILHAAGIAHVDTSGASEERKREYYRVNTDLTAEVAKKARMDGAGQFLFLSSIIVYGDPAPIGERKVITRETRPAPAGFYGDSKLRAEERLTEIFDRRNDEIVISMPGTGEKARKAEARKTSLCILRLPMVYGPGCKGNYRMLERFAGSCPVFPDVPNERSAISIENLCRFLYLMIRNREEGLFFPQDGEYLCTSGEVQRLAEQNGRRFFLTKAFTPALRGLSKLGAGCAADGKRGGFPSSLFGKTGALVDKAFGNLVYAPELSEYRKNYRAPEGRHGRSAIRRVAAAAGSSSALPTVSVVTVCRNAERELAETAESVLAQALPPDEYLIIDGASTDETVRAAESFRERMEQKGIAYRVVSEPDGGIYDAMNKGAALASGEILGILNAGDRYETDAVRCSAETFARTGCDASFGNIRLRRRDGSTLVKKARVRGGYQTSRDWNHPTMFVRTELLKGHPFLCKGIHDDYGFYLYLVKSGARIQAIDRTLAEFRMGGASNRRSLKEAGRRIRDRYRYCYRVNGYSPLYLAECIAIEGAKALLG